MSPPAGRRMYSSQNCVPLWQLQTDYVQHVFIYSIFIDLYAVCLYINTVRRLKCLLFPRIFSVLTVYLLQQRNKLTRMKPSVSRLLLSLTWVNMKQQWDAVTSQLIGTRWHHSLVFKLALRPDRPESSSLFIFLHQRMNDCVNSIRNSSNQIFFFILLFSNSFFFSSSVSSLRLLVLFICSSCFRLFPPRPRLCALSDATWHLTSEVSVWMCDIIIDDSAVFIFYIKWKWAQVLLRLSSVSSSSSCRRWKLSRLKRFLNWDLRLMISAVKGTVHHKMILFNKSSPCDQKELQLLIILIIY